MGDVLVVDDDSMVREVVVSYLRAAGHQVREVANGEGALMGFRAQQPDIVVLDLMLPGMDGLEVCRRLREQADVPIVMLTALGAESDRVVGLEHGADDYVAKPFSPRELVLRVNSVLRRSLEHGKSDDVVLVDGDLRLDVGQHVATRDGERLNLTTREFELLRFFLSNAGLAFTRSQLLEKVWGWSFGDQSTVTVHVRRLREKVEPDPTRPTRLATVWGVGYRWEAQA